MTCIVGVKYPDMTVLAGDYLLSSVEDMTKYHGPAKVIEGKQWAIGLADSSRTEHYIRKVVTNKTKFKKLSDVSDFVDDLIAAILESGTFVASPDSSGFIEFPLELLIASPYGLWEVSDDLSIFEIELFTSIGSGKSVAVGAFAIHEKYKDLLQLTAKEVAQGCLEASGDTCMNVGNKFWFRGFVNA